MTNPAISISMEPVVFDNEAQVLESQMFTLANLQMLKELIRQCMNDMLTLRLEQGKEAEYACNIARVNGEIAAYSYLLSQHELATLTTLEGN